MSTETITVTRCDRCKRKYNSEKIPKEGEAVLDAASDNGPPALIVGGSIVKVDLNYDDLCPGCVKTCTSAIKTLQPPPKRSKKS